MVCYVVVLVVQCFQVVVKCLACTIGEPLGFVDLKAFCFMNVKFRVVMFGLVPPTISKCSIWEWSRPSLSQFFHFNFNCYKLIDNPTSCFANIQVTMATSSSYVKTPIPNFWFLVRPFK
jgi:hypothetical protein